jgi:hypothetical protein
MRKASVDSAKGMSLDVRDGCDVIPVDCVSRECMDMELLDSLATVNVDIEVDISCKSGQRKR